MSDAAGKFELKNLLPGKYTIGVWHEKLKVEEVRRAEAASIARRLRQLLESGEPLVWDAEAAERFHVPLSTLNQKIKRLNIEIRKRVKD